MTPTLKPLSRNVLNGCSRSNSRSRTKLVIAGGSIRGTARTLLSTFSEIGPTPTISSVKNTFRKNVTIAVVKFAPSETYKGS